MGAAHWLLQILVDEREKTVAWTLAPSLHWSHLHTVTHSHTQTVTCIATPSHRVIQLHPDTDTPRHHYTDTHGHTQSYSQSHTTTPRHYYIDTHSRPHLDTVTLRATLTYPEIESHSHRHGETSTLMITFTQRLSHSHISKDGHKSYSLSHTARDLCTDTVVFTLTVTHSHTLSMYFYNNTSLACPARPLWPRCKESEPLGCANSKGIQSTQARPHAV